jgi:hypothetical protein
MITNIHIPIDVSADFCRKNLVFPKYFYWNGNRYDINKVELMYKKYQGQRVIYYFEVTDKANYFKISFDSLNLRWYLEAFQNS